MAGDFIALEGTVVELARGDLYTVEVELGGVRRRVLAKRSGRLNTHHIKIVCGDVVTVEVSPFDVSRGRITFRGPKREGRST